MKTMSKWVLAVCVSLTAAALPLPAAAPRGPAGEVYQKTLRGTALVLSARGRGMAWVVSREKKQLITCQHVVGTNEQVVVLFPEYQDGRVIVRPDWYAREGDPVRGRVVAADAGKDLALVEVERLPEAVTELRLAQEAPDPGDPVHAVGCPGGSALWVYAPGTVRAVADAEWQDEARARHAARVLETTIPLSPGDSGGPLVNDDAELIGVNQGRSRTAQLLSQSIEAGEVRRFLLDPPPARPPAEDSYRSGLGHKARKEYRQAALAFLEAIERDPKHLPAHVQLAWALNELGEYDLALPVCLAALELDPGNADAWRESGYALLKNRQYELAEKALRIAVARAPADRLAKGFLIRALEAQGKAEEAQAVRDELGWLEDRQPE
jgi:hypothetical protein